MTARRASGCPTSTATCSTRLTRRAHFVWIAGNHDPAPPPAGWGDVAEEINDGPLIFRHEALFGPARGEISGHFHPVAALTVRGRGMRRRCFLTDGHRLILPAFGTYAGGLNALDPAIAQLFPDDYDALVVGRDTVRRLSWRQLRPDARRSLDGLGARGPLGREVPDGLAPTPTSGKTPMPMA